MKNYLLACLLGAATTSLLPSFQDPQKPVVPPPTPAAAPPPAAKGVQPVSHPLEGVYELRARMIDGSALSERSRGYLAITKRHMFICFVAPGVTEDLPLLRAGVRTWKTDRDDLVRTEFKVGFFTDSEGKVHVDAPGEAEVKRIEQLRGKIRVWQDEKNYLEFERVE